MFLIKKINPFLSFESNAPHIFLELGDKNLGGKAGARQRRRELEITGRNREAVISPFVASGAP